jgi:hypothetical protein
MSDADTSEFGYVPETPDDFWPGQWLPREEIEPNDWNPNDMAEPERERLFKSLMDNGWTQPIVVHAEEHYIIDGEQRWSVAEREELARREDITPPDVPAGYVPVYGITVDENHAKVATIQHNRARGFTGADDLREYLRGLTQFGVLDSDDVKERVDVNDEESRRLLDEVTAREEVGKGVEFSPPWEPVDRTAMPEEEVEETRSEEVKQAIEVHYDEEKEEKYEEEEIEEAEEIIASTARCNFVMGPEEQEIAGSVLGVTNEAESFINLVQWIIENDYIDHVQDA